MDTFYSCLSPEQLTLMRLPISPPDYFLFQITLDVLIRLTSTP
jgi:hypothetical protein